MENGTKKCAAHEHNCWKCGRIWQCNKCKEANSLDDYLCTDCWLTAWGETDWEECRGKALAVIQGALTSPEDTGALYKYCRQGKAGLR